MKSFLRAGVCICLYYTVGHCRRRLRGTLSRDTYASRKPYERGSGAVDDDTRQSRYRTIFNNIM